MMNSKETCKRIVQDLDFATDNSQELTDDGLAVVCAKALALWMHYSESADYRGVLSHTFRLLANTESLLKRPTE